MNIRSIITQIGSSTQPYGAFQLLCIDNFGFMALYCFSSGIIIH